MDSATERLRSLLGADAFEAAEKAAAEERPVECEASANQGSQSTPTSLAKDKIVAHAVFEESEDDDHQANTANLVGSRKKHQKGATLPPGQHGLEELAPPDMEFCPIMAVAKFPYRYMEAQSQESEEVSARFFANGKFWARAWTLYYLHPPVDLFSKPLILVPATEVRQLFAEINGALKLRVSFGKQVNESGFLIDFPSDGTPRPRYLGQSNSRDMYDKLEKTVPADGSKPKDLEYLVDANDNKSLEAFKDKFRMAAEEAKSKSRKTKAQKAEARAAMKQVCCKQLARTQRYLGIRRIVPEDLMEGMTSMVSEEPLATDMQQPAPFIFESNVVFVSVDVEAWEKSPHPITEIGVSTLDTADLEGVAPGEGGVSWLALIKARHFRISEHLDKVNCEHLVGCPERFEFGASEIISTAVADEKLDECFTIEYDKLGFFGPRRVVFVGHDGEADIKFLRRVGYDVQKLPQLHDKLDTVRVFRAFRHDLTSNPSRLVSVLYDLDITGWNVHNAGNDAAYTLQALIRMAVLGLVPHHKRAHKPVATLAADASADAAAHINAELSEWELAEDLLADGGQPDARPPVAAAAGAGAGARDTRGGARIGTDSRGASQGRGQGLVIAPDHGIRGYCSDCGAAKMCAMGCDHDRLRQSSGRGHGARGGWGHPGRGGFRGRGRA